MVLAIVSCTCVKLAGIVLPSISAYLTHCLLCYPTFTCDLVTWSQGEIVFTALCLLARV